MSLLIFAASCASGEEPPPPQKGSLKIINQSQYVLQEIRIHPSISYLETAKQWPEPLAIESSYVFHALGPWYVTVFREKYRDGPLIAISTADAIELKSKTGLQLQVFDESFRLMPSDWIPTSTMSATSASSLSDGI